MVDAKLTYSDDRHARQAWIWSATIIVATIILTAMGMFAQLANQSSWDADKGVIGERASHRH